ncbi:MAG: hypothetical protein KJO31_08165 [Gammaproteobacteria bacterium]|nr:hypothetical protein [Gammaproteobacteria bacterium]
MKTVPRRLIVVSVLALILVPGVYVYQAAQRLMVDRYADDPQVVALPPDYEPMAPAEPYSGAHPALRDRHADDYAYPIPIGGTGPVLPTYADSLDYPFACRTEAAGLGQPLPDNDAGAGTPVYAVDAAGARTTEIIGYSKDCGLRSRVHYLYRSKTSGEFLPYSSMTDDVDHLTIDGQEVPFIVRIESGTINRYIYMIALLRGPEDTPGQPDLEFWNGKLIYLFRGGVGIGRRQGRISLDYIPDRRWAELQKGFAVAHATANQTSTQYDIELAEDTFARMKRHFAARYGEPTYTIGMGGSGGAIQQYLIGQNRPGLLDGGIAMQSYPDMVTQTTKVMDCELLEHYFDVTDAENPKWQKWSQRRWVQGFNARDDMSNDILRLRAIQSLSQFDWPVWSGGQTECTRSWRNLTPQIANPRYSYFASLFAPDVFARVSWTYWDNLKRVYGTDTSGHARRTFDNVGVQYGLRALKRRQVSPEEFLKLNDAIGGWKPAAEMEPERYWIYSAARSGLDEFSVWSDHNMYKKESPDLPARRSVGDLAAMQAAYRSGQVFIGQLEMPIIDFRNYLEPELDMHHSLQSFSARLRMIRHQGQADTQLIWFTRKPNLPFADAIDLLDRWIVNLQANPDLGPVSSKPADAQDRCYSDAGGIIASGDDVWDGAWNRRENGECMETYPIYSHPRIEAGDDYIGDIFKCHLQSIDAAIDRGLYAPVNVLPYRDELMRVFPDGVCDYSRGDAARPPDLLR